MPRPCGVLPPEGNFIKFMESSFNDILNQLNPEQRQAVRQIDGPVLVLAGAGTGKTKVITYRIAYMLNCGIAPENILGMTFTNKAAAEMKERLAVLIGKEKADRVTLGTFHSFCIRLLRKEITKLNYLPSFTVADDGDQTGLIKQAASSLGLDKEESVADFAAYIGRMKNKLFNPQEAAAEAAFDMDKVRAAVYAEYQTLLVNQNMIDFDDMLFLTYRVFDEFPETLKKYQEIYRYLLIDEYQDTNDVQFTILDQICREHRNICVVGDDDQSIYGWRGAKIENILNFPKLFPNVKEVKLEQNYRSTNTILAAANAVIAANSVRYEKNLWSSKGKGSNIIQVSAENAESEAAFIADYIKQEMGECSQLSYNDFAVLYRSNHLSRQLEQSLRAAGVPYKLVGGQEFYKRKEIRDAVAYLKLLVNPREDQSLLRVLNLPPRGMGDKAVESLKRIKNITRAPLCTILGGDEYLKSLSGKAATAAQTLDCTLKKYRESFAVPGQISIKVRDFLDECEYLPGMKRIYKDHNDAEKRLDNVYEFINAIALFERKNPNPVTLLEYLEAYALLEENDRTDDNNDGDSVTLTTVHAAKGLEFNHVIIVAMEKDIFPHERSIEERSVEEELRLFYVALTRARHQLVITHTERRMTRGFETYRYPSPFLNLLPEEAVDQTTPSQLIRFLSDDEALRGIDSILAKIRGSNND
jgi:DNA helicase-2/ATP-dependent DNA helicase PcrA